MYISRRLLRCEEKVFTITNPNNNFKSSKKNGQPRSQGFSFEGGRGREKPWERGWKMARDKRDNLKIDFLTYWKASATTVWSVNSFSTILHLLCKKPITISKLNILGFHVASSFSKRKKINRSEVLVSLVFQTLSPTGLLSMLNNKIMSSRFLSRDSWRGSSLNQLSRMEMESE